MTAPATKATAAPTETKGRFSVARLTDYWYVACQSRKLKSRKPLSLRIMDTPLVAWRSKGGVASIVLDRCPHRNVPLSTGEVAGEHLRCTYHGWEFDTDGACRHVPGLRRDVDGQGRARRVLAYPTREQDGFVWVWMNPDKEPDIEPPRNELLGDSRYTHAYREAFAEGTLHAVIENALDVPHTAFLHKGLFRGTGETNDIDAVVRRYSDRVEAQYVGEPRPEGVAAKILAPGGAADITHFDRFVLPSVAEVEYSIGDATHVLVTSYCTPISDFETHLFAVVSFRLPLPGWLIKPVLEPVGRAIFSQDARMLKKQTANVTKFGGEQYQSTEIDVLGPQIWRLMKAAERGEAGRAVPGEEPVTKTVPLRV